MKLEKNDKVTIDLTDLETLIEHLKEILPAFGVEFSSVKVKYPDNVIRDEIWIRRLDEPQELKTNE